MSSRSFTSSGTSRITFAIGASNHTGDYSLAVIARRTTDGVLQVMFYAGTATSGGNRYQFAVLNTNVLHIREGGNTLQGPGFTASDGWCLVGISKVSAGTPRWHKYVFNTATWTHEDDTATLANHGTPATSCYIGDWSGGGDAFGGDIMMVGYWNAVLTDAQFEALVAGLAPWYAVLPTGLWLVDQSATGQNVPDHSGNGSNQSAIITTGMGIGSASPWAPGQAAA